MGTRGRAVGTNGTDPTLPGNLHIPGPSGSNCRNGAIRAEPGNGSTFIEILIGPIWWRWSLRQRSMIRLKLISSTQLINMTLHITFYCLTWSQPNPFPPLCLNRELELGMNNMYEKLMGLDSKFSRTKGRVIWNISIGLTKWRGLTKRWKLSRIKCVNHDNTFPVKNNCGKKSETCLIYTRSWTSAATEIASRTNLRSSDAYHIDLRYRDGNGLVGSNLQWLELWFDGLDLSTLYHRFANWHT